MVLASSSSCVFFVGLRSLTWAGLAGGSSLGDLGWGFGLGVKNGLCEGWDGIGLLGVSIGSGEGTLRSGLLGRMPKDPARISDGVLGGGWEWDWGLRGCVH